MLPASNQGVGENIGFPDVCNTPIGTGTSPITYPNQGSNAAAVPFCPTILLSCMPAHSQAAKPLMTNGDNAGVAHSAFMQPGGNNLGNAKVLLQGMPAETLANPAQGNNYNCSTDAKLVPSVTNVLMGYVPLTDGGWRARLDEVADRPLRGWGLTLDGPHVVHARRGQAGQRVGLRPGDVLLTESRGRIVWRRGDAVHTARRPAVDPAPLRLTRDRDGVARLIVRRISRGVVPAVRQALSRCHDARALELDLRGNPGGDVTQALALAGLFLPGGTPLLTATGPAGQGVGWRTLDAAPAYAGPLRLRVDAQTASAAEVLACVLVAHDRVPPPNTRTAAALRARLVDAARAVDLGAWTLRHPSGAQVSPL